MKTYVVQVTSKQKTSWFVTKNYLAREVVKRTTPERRKL